MTIILINKFLWVILVLGQRFYEFFCEKFSGFMFKGFEKGKGSIRFNRVIGVDGRLFQNWLRR